MRKVPDTHVGQRPARCRQDEIGGESSDLTAAVKVDWIITRRRGIASRATHSSLQRCKHLESGFAAGASLAGMPSDCAGIPGRLIAPVVKDRQTPQITFLGLRQPTVFRQPTKA